jgi:hypothetical protein
MTAGSGTFDAREHARSVLPPLGWLFVSMAFVEAWLVLQNMHVEFGPVPGVIVSGDTGAPIALIAGLGDVAPVLLPAAILYRVPSATRTYPMLLIGAGLVAAWTLFNAAFTWWAGNTNDVEQVVSASTFAQIATLARFCGLVLMAAGLRFIRVRRPSSRAIAATVAAIATALLPTALIYLRFDLTGVNIALIGLDLATTIAIGAWLGVPIGAWLDGERPGRFWLPLAVVSVAGLGVNVLQAIQSLTIRPSTSFFIDGFGAQLWVGLVSALVTLAVFALALPSKRTD